MSNDIDSLLSCTILNQKFGYKVSYFYDFNKLYKSTVNEKLDDIIGVDLALCGNRMVWCNHVTMISPTDEPNPNSANINNIFRINRESYFQKYCMGTHFQLIDFYNVFKDIDLTDEQKIFLWGIDCSYSGHFSRYDNDKNAHARFIELFELNDIATVFDGRYSESDFDSIMQKYKLYEHIHFDSEGKLVTNIEIAKLQELFPMLDFMNILDNNFELAHEFPKPQFISLDHSTTYTNKGNGWFSGALVGKNKFVGTRMK